MLFLSKHEKWRHRLTKNGLSSILLMVSKCKHESFEHTRRTWRTSLKCSTPAKCGQVPLEATTIEDFKSQYNPYIWKETGWVMLQSLMTCAVYMCFFFPHILNVRCRNFLHLLLKIRLNIWVEKWMEGNSIYFKNSQLVKGFWLL